jgi:hypothetical protein
MVSKKMRAFYIKNATFKNKDDPLFRSGSSFMFGLALEGLAVLPVTHKASFS